MEMGSTRLYASAIAIVSGLYSLAAALLPGLGEPMMDDAATIGGFLMAAVGTLVLVHGIVLLTPAIGLLRTVSGPLMVVWAVIMLLIQVLGVTMPGFAMPGMGLSMTAAMGWDAGMVAIAILMLVSGLIMTRPGTRGAEM